MMEKLLNSSLKELEEIPVDKIVNTGIGFVYIEFKNSE